MRSYNREIAAEILQKLPESKMTALRNACTRNAIFTSSYGLENATMTVYIEGVRIQLTGCQSSFSVYDKDNDGEFEIMRKPNENKLHKLYDEWGKTDSIIDLYELTK